MRRSIFRSVIIGSAFALMFFSVHAQSNAANAEPHYFSFVHGAGDPLIDANEFIVEVNDAQIVEQYRSMIANRVLQPNIAFVGTVEKGRVAYNEAWNFHVVPETLVMGSGFAPEVCDAAPQEIEDHVSEIDGAGGFLPNSLWCPWSLHISREVLR